jgi:cytochrome c oxidase cbb3-type subunit 2
LSHLFLAASLTVVNQAAAQEANYKRYCSSCHGDNGDGQGPNARQFENQATDFTRGIYECRSTPTGTLPTDGDLRRSIVEGLAGTGMPDFVALGPLQIDKLVKDLKSFSPRFAREKPGTPIEIPPQPTDDPASVAKGRQLYDNLKCANCHGWHGEGGPGAANLHNDDASPAHVTNFLRKKSLKCGDSPSDIYRTLMTGLDGTPMSSYAEVASEEDIWNLVHYLMSIRR